MIGGARMEDRRSPADAVAVDRALRAFADSGIDRSREEFLAQLLRELAAAMQDFIGVEECRSFFATVGDEVGRVWNAEYRHCADIDRLNLAQSAAALVDLKARIGGDFQIASIDRNRLTLVNSRCPFGESVRGRPAMCQMTSTVFGRIVADNLGYARIRLEETIAEGAKGCRVVVDLGNRAGDGTESGDEYFRVEAGDEREFASRSGL